MGQSTNAMTKLCYAAFPYKMALKTCPNACYVDAVQSVVLDIKHNQINWSNNKPTTLTWILYDYRVSKLSEYL